MPFGGTMAACIAYFSESTVLLCLSKSKPVPLMPKFAEI